MQSSHNIQSNISKLNEELTCPVTLDLLTEAVCLVPCAHKIQNVVAEDIFGPVGSGWMVTSNKKCPVCVQPVVGYLKDHSTRAIVAEFSAISQETLQNVLKEIKPTLAQKSEVVYPYPGIAAKFMCINDNWEFSNDLHSSKLCKTLIFTSVTAKSLITKFDFLGYRDGEVRISIEFSRDNLNILKTYLGQYNIRYIDCPGYVTNDIQETKTLFKILASNNEIPIYHVNFINNILEKGFD